MRRAFLRRRAGILLAFMVSALSGCRHETASESWFPLAAGHCWTYRVVTQWSDGNVDEHTLSLTTLGEEPLPAVAEAGQAWRRHSDEGVDYWLLADASGVRRVASRALFDEAPLPDPPQRYVLKAPFAVGTEWEASTTAYVLTRKFDFPREVRYTYKPVPMTYRIEAVDDSVDTPAGHYGACLRVRGTATMQVYADPVGGWREVPLTSVEWYCRGVGLVRVERTEPSPSTYTLGGTQVMALLSLR